MDSPTAPAGNGREQDEMTKTRKAATSHRSVEWGHWGLTFSWQTPGQYAPDKIEGQMFFPVGNCGPCDSGPGQRERYREVCRRWVVDGVLPDCLYINPAWVKAS